MLGSPLIEMFTDIVSSAHLIFNIRMPVTIFNLNVQGFWGQPLPVILAVQNMMLQTEICYQVILE